MMPPGPRLYQIAMYRRGFRDGAAFVLIVVAITILVAWFLTYG